MGLESGLRGWGDDAVDDEEVVDEASDWGKDARVQYEPSDSPSLH